MTEKQILDRMNRLAIEYLANTIIAAKVLGYSSSIVEHVIYIETKTIQFFIGYDLNDRKYRLSYFSQRRKYYSFSTIEELDKKLIELL